MTTFLRTSASLVIIFLLQANIIWAQSPTITSFNPSAGAVGSLVTINGSNLSKPTSLKIGGVNAITASNTGNKLVAMVMPGATNGQVSVIVGKDTAISANNFSVVSSKLPNKQRGDKLVGNHAADNIFQGRSTALSADGSTAIVGNVVRSYNDSLGSAWVYTRNSGGVWVQQGNWLGIDGMPSSSSYPVALSADGNTAIVGGHTNVLGTAWIFTRKNGIWGSSIQLAPAANEYILQNGNFVALSADGNTAIVGGADHGMTDWAAAWIYVRDSSGIWSGTYTELIGPGAANYSLTGSSATSVALSADGKIAVLGNPIDGINGSVWIFRKNNDGSWNQNFTKLTIPFSGNAYDLLFGNSVSANADGSTIVIGGPGDGLVQYTGVWVYTRTNDSTWVQQGPVLTGGVTAAEDARQGSSVSVSADGNSIVSGGASDDGFTGGMWLYARDKNGVWAQQNKFIGSGAVGNGNQGYSVAISADGSTAIEGGITDSLRGAAWIFTDSASVTLPVNLANFTAFQLGKGVQTAWTGLDEIGMASYAVERSSNNYQFQIIGNIAAKNNGSADNDYLFFDAKPLAGDNFYRVKAISKDGTIQYTKVVKVSMDDGKTGIQVYPNPVSGKTIQLQLNNVVAGAYNIAIYNTAGQKVYSGSYVHAGGSATVAVSVKGVVAGIYHIDVQSSKSKFSGEVVVQ